MVPEQRGAARPEPGAVAGAGYQDVVQGGHQGGETGLEGGLEAGDRRSPGGYA